MTICLTTSAGVIGGNEAASCPAVHLSRIQPALEAVTVGGGEAQPTKWTTLSEVTTSNRGAPLSQCDPSRPDFRMS
jgi:hypothetical protein